MKKVLFLLPLLAALFVFSGCSDDEETKEAENILLNHSEIEVNVGETTDIEVTGVNIDECTVSSDNDFIAEAMIYNGKIEIDAEHIGEAIVTINKGEANAQCKVKVNPTIDYIGETITEWGIPYNELNEIIEKPYDSFFDDSQRGSKNFTYIRSGYRVINRYYFKDDALCGVEKQIYATGSDSDSFINITNSLREYANYETSYSDVINGYPNVNIDGYVYNYPQKYYAVYEQRIYGYISFGNRPETTNIIYYASDLEAAKNHQFTME